MNFKESVNNAIGIIDDKISSWVEHFIVMLPNLIIAIIVVITFAYLARLARWGFKKIFKKSPATNDNILTIGANISYFIVTVIGLFIALSILNLDKTVTSILAGAGVVGIALGFAFQDTAANFISGLFIAFRKPFKKGDFIETLGFTGTVIDINVRSTKLETVHGLEVILPNKEVFQNSITNFTSTRRRRVDIDCGVGYDDDLELAEKVAREAVADLTNLDTERENPVTFTYNEFGGSSINFTITIWLVKSQQTSYIAAKSEAIKKIKKAFDENGINIPFPIRTLDIENNTLDLLSKAIKK